MPLAHNASKKPVILKSSEGLSDTQIYQDYKNAFEKASGLPLSFIPFSNPNSPQQTPNPETMVCKLMQRESIVCKACEQLHGQLKGEALDRARTMMCFAGMAETAVPVYSGDKVLGHLQTGQVLLSHPTKDKFSKMTRTLLQLGLENNLSDIEESYFQTRILSKEQYEAFIYLLSTFAEHISHTTGKLEFDYHQGENPFVLRARTLIENNITEAIELEGIANKLNMSASYFSRMFRQKTGITFSDYIARLRVEKAKMMLSNSNLRISDIAFRVGFQSISQFNRTFSKLAGATPSTYRKDQIKTL